MALQVTAVGQERSENWVKAQSTKLGAPSVPHEAKQTQLSCFP